MKKYRLNLKDYKVMLNPAGRCKECGSLISDKFDDYLMRNSLEELLLNPNQGLNDEELIRNDNLAKRIKHCSEDEILVSEEEYQILRSSLSNFKGFSVMDVELVKRIHKPLEEINVNED